MLQKNIALLSLIIFLLLGITTVFAQPEISSVTGTMSHNGTIVINGSEFGEKSPAEPLVWDDCSAAPSLDTYYAETLPRASNQGSQYNMAYRDVAFLRSRSIGLPNNKLNYVLAGAHATDYAGSYPSGNNVSLLVPCTSFKFFVQYWYRVDPNFDDENHESLPDNMKELCLSGDPSQIYGRNTWGYYNWCNSHVPDSVFTGPIKLSRIPVDNPAQPYACTPDSSTVLHNNPVNGWIKMQWEGDYDTRYDNPTVRFTTYPDGKVTYRSHYENPITTFEILYGVGHPSAGELRSIGIGGFARVPRFNNGTNSFRYFAAIYVDNTHSRIMLGDKSDYSSCTIMEPQIPSEWSNNSITCTVNLGSMPASGVAYLFVFDADNNHNSEGYPVNMNYSEGGIGTAQLDPPTGLEIVDIEN